MGGWARGSVAAGSRYSGCALASASRSFGRLTPVGSPRSTTRRPRTKASLRAGPAPGACVRDPNTRRLIGSVRGRSASEVRSHRDKSATHPTLSSPALPSMLTARYPPLAASSRAVWRPSGQSRYSGVVTARRMVASLSASRRSCPSDEHAPSQPIATFTPAAAYSSSGATPDPSRRLESGLCTAVAPALAIRATSSGSSHTACAQLVPGSCKNPHSCRNFTAEPVGRLCFAIRACARVSRRWVWPQRLYLARSAAAPEISSFDAE
mmetsp:Transcript_343/g.1127  ORF Transcript_343/g.1127 Transcript_343/m.1127 type:complete len:266 (-) Transcript_343:767-1564(-)